MENTEQKTNRPNDEIDLIELFSRMWAGIQTGFFWMLEQLKNLLILVIRKLAWIAIFCLVGAVYGFLLHRATENYFSSQAALRSNGISNTHVIEFINQFKDLINNQNYTAISERLGINREQVKDIKSIGAYYGIDINKDRVMDFIDFDIKYDPLDTLMARLPVMVYIKIELQNETVFQDVKKAVIDYVSKNPFIIANNNIRIRQTQEQLKSIDLEIKKLDSLQKIQYFDVPRTQRASTNQMLVLNEKDMKLYHDIILGLKGGKQSLEKEIELYSEPITIMQPFTELSVDSKPLMEYLIPRAIYFAILGFIVSLFWQYRRMIYNVVVNNQE